MASIVFTFVGEQDPYSPKTEEEGSIVSLLRHLLEQGKQIRKVILLHTEGTQRGAIETKEWISLQSDLQLVETEVYAVSESLSNDPTDLLLAAQEVRKRLEELTHTQDHIEFNASSGTPAMKSSFSILQASGYVKNATVWQVRNPKQMKADQQRVFATDVGVLRREFELQVFRSQVENFNYDGAYELFSVSDIADHFPQKKLIGSYLEAGNLWQRSKMDDFKNCIYEYVRGDQQSQFAEWYYLAYEEAYLATVRLKQGSIVEAFFHGFRAFEGILAFWAKREFGVHISEEENGSIHLKESVFEERERYFKGAKYKLRNEQSEPDNDIAKLEVKLREFFLKEKNKPEGKKKKNYLLDFPALRTFFRAIRDDYKVKCPLIKDLLTDKISDKRNVLVHQLSGLSEQDLYQFWKVSSREEWERTILEFLNFIAEQSYSSWDEICLMPAIHQHILTAIANYQP